MNGNQLNLYDMAWEQFKITKPIRLIELFSGYGSQALALKYLKVPFEHWKICEWAIKSIQAYKDIHFTDKDIELNSKRTKEEMVEFLYRKGISNNYNEPMAKEQIQRLSEEQLKTIIKNIAITHNLVNIQQVKGKDLEIEDTDKYDYILTYSFPCQDLSLAGKGKGMSDTSTRSGMLWEVERILQECKDLGNLPQVLLMENVPQVHSQDNLADFNKWKLRLEELGYNNYFQDLIATDYGIPQTRNRCFMVSLLGDYSYQFPKPIPLKLKLKDMLEDNVNEKYYLSDKMIEYISANNEKWTGNNGEALINKTYASTLNTREGMRRCDSSNYISDDVEENYDLKNIHKTLKETLEQNEIKDGVNYIDAYNRTIDNSGLSKTISTRVNASNNTYLAIKNATKQGYLEAVDGDGIDISSRMKHHRGTVQKDKVQTLTTQCERGVWVGTYQYAKSDKFMQGKDRLQLGKDTSDTLQTTPKEGVVINPLKGISGESWQFEQQVYDENDSARTLKASEGSGNIPKVMNDLRIRKLTPRECGRLMGVRDEDIDKISLSDSAKYHIFGDSIIVNVLMAIFKEML